MNILNGTKSFGFYVIIMMATCILTIDSHVHYFSSDIYGAVSLFPMEFSLICVTFASTFLRC